ncbi:hypothetical protein COLO4_25275 [Corchorus olitorius]|uniref:Uncharacterized protein n=1 Tax=Corchorus olitorius TaxID=93759 RepID=A0A1R3I3U5_9ROSI|nr:hypothetical protein COLO4_25275 [Corchorus olitorius]
MAAGSLSQNIANIVAEGQYTHRTINAGKTEWLSI